MNSVEEDCFAWALLEAAGSFLDDCANSWLCAKLGAGEAQAVIRDLLAGFASSGVALPTALAASLWSWANGFKGSDEESRIRDIVARVQLVVGDRLTGDADGEIGRPER
ncbi:hypothetical protein [Mycolicibacterium sp. P9-22]|uniref:hypothetical protein n=1 Tax=Mycolicibacterium sp. P9-22 TaxID=2024613 RepID=UPI0011ECD4FD|nr:hypothetical protein [Mycolicibacterium sp. P9-22]KAA0120600.1 hypothetical protein CIW51_03815 [Mycolicibacterium sp. P9-22]